MFRYIEHILVTSGVLSTEGTEIKDAVEKDIIV